MAKVITNNFKLNSAQQLLESISEPANTTYYLFTAKHTSYGTSGDVPTTPYDTVEERTKIFKDMIFGKRISQNDVSLMIKKSLYTAGTVYNHYDDTSNSLFTDTVPFYATVQSGSYYHTFKCLDNNNDSESTSAPDFSNVDPEDEYIQTLDGYIWKYMYSVSDTEVAKFATSDFFPVVANTTVADNARPGTIDVIKVVAGGQGYDNYVDGTFSVSDVRLGGNDYIYGVNSNNTINSTDNFYTGCVVKITSGTGAGQYRRVVNYYSNSTTKAIVITSPFTVVPDGTSTYELRPEVRIQGDGYQTVEAAARGLINTTSNSIYYVEMLNTGKNYRYAVANVYSHPVAGVVQEATIRPILSPELGHGHDAYSELGASRICFGVTFTNSEGNTIPSTHEYRQIGLLKDPVFSYATFDISNQSGIFSEGEDILRIQPVRVYANAVTVNTSASDVTAADADFENQFTAGEFIYLTSTTGQQLAVINSITNSSHLVLKSTNGLIACTSTKVFKVDMSYRMESFSTSIINLTGNASVNTTSANLVYTPANVVFNGNVTGGIVTLGNTTNTGWLTTGTANTLLFVNNDVVTYLVKNGNTAIGGLANNTNYVVTTINSTAIQLKNTAGSYVNLSSVGTGPQANHTLVGPGLNTKLRPNSYIVISSNSTGYVSNKRVNSITNSSVLVMDSNNSFANTDSKIALINYNYSANTGADQIIPKAVLTSYVTGQLQVANVDGVFQVNDLVVGRDTGAIATIDSITRAGSTKGFDTFINMYKYIGGLTSGTFLQDEIIYQTDVNMNYGYLHSMVGSSDPRTFYVTDQFGTINTGGNITGANSGAIASITTKYAPELVFESGQVMYIENIEAVPRSSTQSETFKLIFEF